MANGDTKTESYLRVAAEGTRADLPTDTCCNTKTQNLILGVANRIMDVEDEVEEIINNPDVVDIVDTYADLQAYDTQHLTENDIIRVLQDETHDGNSTYYRFTKNPDTWTFIGEISGGGSGITELTNADYNYPNSNPNGVALWSLKSGVYYWQAGVTVYSQQTTTRNAAGIAIVTNAETAPTLSSSARILLMTNDGAFSEGSTTGGVQYLANVLTSTNVQDSLNSTSTWQPLSANQGKVLNEKIEGRVITGSGAPTTSTVGTVGKLYEDTTNGKLYQCTAVSGSTYTWTEVGAGGGGTGLARVLTNDDYNAKAYSWTETDPTKFNCIATWKLPSGIYTFKPSGNNYSVQFFLDGGTSKVATAVSGYIVLVAQPDPDNNNAYGEVVFFDGANSVYITGVHPDGTNGTKTEITPTPTDNLTSYSIMKALSANQGRVLNEKIIATKASGAPTTSTTGFLGKVYIDSSTTDAYICVDDTANNYVWKKITA